MLKSTSTARKNVDLLSMCNLYYCAYVDLVHSDKTVIACGVVAVAFSAELERV